MHLSIYVPKPGTFAAKTILPKSGIVGTIQEDGRIRIDYEGNKYGSANVKNFADRVLHAAGRHTYGDKGYPTVARMWVDQQDVIEVGCWDGCYVRVLGDEAIRMLERWLDVTDLLNELVPSGSVINEVRF